MFFDNVRTMRIYIQLLNEGTPVWRPACGLQVVVRSRFPFRGFSLTRPGVSLYDSDETHEEAAVELSVLDGKNPWSSV